MAGDELLNRDEVLGGLPARRARALLFLIESRTAHLAATSRQAAAWLLTEQAVRERDLAFFEAFTLGREPPLRPTIQDLERHAPHWTPLVPANPQVRAALAHLLGEKYTLAAPAVPGMQAALGLDEPAVGGAYERLYARPIASIYAPRTGLVERLRWVWARLAGRLESLPPFWTAYALTFTETVGASILALPIAVAGIGPLPALAILVGLGLINILTVAAMAEAVARNGSIRYGRAFFGRLVAEYLGGTGVVLLSVGLTTICLVALLVYYIGLSRTLADATAVSPALWCALLCLVGLYFVSRESLSATIASALVVGGVSVGLICLLVLLALFHLQPANLMRVNLPLLNGQPFDPSILRLIFGVVLLAYFGHLAVGNCARDVLRRDPSGRSLIGGAVAAQATAVAVYCLWVLAVNGAIPAEVLEGRSDTVLAPLADVLGPGIHLLGGVFVVLAMGMGSVHYSMSLFHLVRERLPSHRRPILTLPRRAGRLLFEAGHGRAGHRTGLVYLGLEAGQPRFHLEVQQWGRARSVEATVRGRWEAGKLIEPLLDRDSAAIYLTVEVLEAGADQVRVRVESSVLPSYQGDWGALGLHLTDLLDVSEEERRIVTCLVRERAASPDRVAAATGWDRAVVAERLEALVQRGLARREDGSGEARYRATFARRGGRQVADSLWERLDRAAEPRPRKAATRLRPAPGWFARRAAGLLLGERGRFVLAASPVLGILLLTEWLFLSGSESFAEPLGLAAVIAGSVIAGLFPVLLLTSSERKSDFVVRAGPGLQRHRLVKGGIYLFFLAGLVLHGLVIWQGPVERLAAFLSAGLAIFATVRMVRGGAFDRRLVVELRQTAGAGGTVAILAGGRPLPTGVRLRCTAGELRLQTAAGELPPPGELRAAILELPESRARELKVWAHRVTPEGESAGLPALLETEEDAEVRRFELGLSDGQVLLPISGRACRVTLTFPEPVAAAGAARKRERGSRLADRLL